MVKHLMFALMALILVSTCLGASSHVSKKVPKSICSKSGGWEVFSVKNNNFNPPSSNPMAQDLLVRQMKELAPHMLKDAAAAYNRSPGKNATLFTKFGTDYSWVLDGCMKSKIVNNVVKYADYKFAVTFHFEQSDPDEGLLAWFYQTNIKSKVYRRGNYMITDWKFKDVTNYE